MRSIRVSFLALAVLSAFGAACATEIEEPVDDEAVSVSEAHLDDNGGGGCVQCYCDSFYCNPDTGGDGGGGGGGGGGEGGPGSGGGEEEPPPWNPYELKFYYNGRSPNPADTCVHLHESADPYWSNNYLCSPTNVGIRWSSAGPIAGLYCRQIREPAEPSYTTWNDNYLCAPAGIFGANTTWSYAGRPLGSFSGCINFNDPYDPHTWGDNWLCY